MIYLTDVDMSQNELQNAVIQNLSQAPANPKIGQVYVDTSEGKPKLVWWNGEEWAEISGGPSTPESLPVVVNPSVTIEVSGTDAAEGVEVGTTIPLTYNAKFNPGSYSYGPETGIIVESWDISDTLGNKSTAASGTFSEVTVGDDTSYKMTATANYSAGAIPVGDQGNPYPASQIPAGSVSASSGSLAGFRKYFYGSTTELAEVTSDLVRSLVNSDVPISAGTNFELEVVDGTNLVVIAFPSNANRKLKSVLDTVALNINISDVFEMRVLDIEGANGYQAISYDVYVYAPDLSLGANTYNVTIS